jgi:Mg-chelatase subunit ChlD
MKDNIMKKVLQGAVVLAIVLGFGLDGYRAATVGASTEGKAGGALGKIAHREFKQGELDIVFVLDNSGSMRNNDPNFITREVVTNFVNDLGPTARLGMVIFGETAELIEPLTSLDNSEIRASFLKSLDVIDFRGKFTNSPAAIERAVYELKTNGRRQAEKIIIFLTDGIVDTGNNNQDLEKEKWLKDDLTQDSKNAGIRIFGIAFTDNADFRLIQTLAVRTEGEYFRVFQVGDLQVVFTRIKKVIAKAPVTRTEDSPVKTKPVVLKVQKQPAENRFESRPAIFAKEYASLLLILSGTVVLLGLTVVGFVARRRKIHTIRPGVANGKLESILRSEPPMPQAVLLDVGKAVSPESLTLPLNKAVLRIGRDKGNDIIISRKTVSSFHASIEYKNGYFYLEDLRSTNGTRLNNHKLRHNEPVRLKSGDRIDFSIHEFRFLIPDQTPLGETIRVNKVS